MRSTKIVATLGPASREPAVLEQLIDAGMNVARINFSHGTYAEHAALIADVRRVAAMKEQPVAILQDLQGPKIRTGALAGVEAVELRPGAALVITTAACDGDARRVSTSYAALPDDVRPGDRVLLSDGLMEVRVVKVTGREVITEVVTGGMLRAHQGINLPGVPLSAPALTVKDREDLAFGLEQEVDLVTLSFVRHAADIREIKTAIAAAGKTTPVVAKIERAEAFDELPEILAEVDGVMVARGDLGVEMPPEQVPILQKQLIEAANAAGRPVITATQMLESMITNPRPTRAEVNDVANAIIDGSDAVMLSGESAVGRYPVEAVAMMARIAEVAEASERHGDLGADRRWNIPQPRSAPQAIAAAAATIVQQIPIAAICVFTLSGNTARLIAQQRPHTPIFAFTPDQRTWRRLNLVWGVIPQHIEFVADLQSLWPRVQPLLQRHLAGQTGQVIMVGGHPFGAGVSTNFIKIQSL
ncbi:MAG TPA: pyruvate kinase [bacterium]|nr:pyruvate kinase [bacterium]HPR86400.1 pyruvate kinase [bacterium]